MRLGAACDWVIRAAIRIRNPHDALGDLGVMLEKASLMLLIHWAKVSYISLMLGRGVTRVEAGGLLGFLFPPMMSLFFFS